MRQTRQLTPEQKFHILGTNCTQLYRVFGLKPTETIAQSHKGEIQPSFHMRKNICCAKINSTVCYFGVGQGSLSSILHYEKHLQTILIKTSAFKLMSLLSISHNNWQLLVPFQSVTETPHILLGPSLKVDFFKMQLRTAKDNLCRGRGLAD